VRAAEGHADERLEVCAEDRALLELLHGLDDNHRPPALDGDGRDMMQRFAEEPRRGRAAAWQLGLILESPGL
jgi:hypothetical protein